MDKATVSTEHLGVLLMNSVCVSQLPIKVLRTTNKRVIVELSLECTTTANNLFNLSIVLYVELLIMALLPT